MLGQFDLGPEVDIVQQGLQRRVRYLLAGSLKLKPTGPAFSACASSVPPNGIIAAATPIMFSTSLASSRPESGADSMSGQENSQPSRLKPVGRQVTKLDCRTPADRVTTDAERHAKIGQAARSFSRRVRQELGDLSVTATDVLQQLDTIGDRPNRANQVMAQFVRIGPQRLWRKGFLQKRRLQRCPPR